MFAERPGSEDTTASQENPGVPYLNVDLSEISVDGFDQLRESPEYYVNFRPFNDCDAYLPIYGDSMYPRYASGEIIVIREVTNYDVLQWGEAYLVVTDERANNMSTVKLVFEHPDEDRLVLRASNPNYRGDMVIEKRFIRNMFIIKGKVTRNQL
nr:S24 family peptidase [Pedobacter sp. SYSU D00382]